MNTAESQSRLTPHEANNAVFLVLRFAWCWLDPTNETIDTILCCLPDTPTPWDVCGAVAEFIRVESGDSLSDQQLSVKRQRAARVIAEFLKQPRSLREDLGEDAGWKPICH